MSAFKKLSVSCLYMYICTFSCYPHLFLSFFFTPPLSDVTLFLSVFVIIIYFLPYVPSLYGLREYILETWTFKTWAWLEQLFVSSDQVFIKLDVCILKNLIAQTFTNEYLNKKLFRLF